MSILLHKHGNRQRLAGGLLNELSYRSRILFQFGLICFFGAAISLVLSFTTNIQVLGINAWIKPTKFFLSVGIFTWTMSWYLHYLKPGRFIKIYQWILILTLSLELVIITWQAANGRLSHFNTTTPFYLMLFNIMGLAIVTIILATVVVSILFFVQKNINLPLKYLWAIRIGLVLFIIFSFQGGMMAARLSHTVGAEDGGNGLPFVNWSRDYGDLRIAHFLGMHALQLIPMFAWFVASKTWHVFLFAGLYLGLVLFVLFRALAGLALI